MKEAGVVTTGNQQVKPLFPSSGFSFFPGKTGPGSLFGNLGGPEYFAPSQVTQLDKEKLPPVEQLYIHYQLRHRILNESLALVELFFKLEAGALDPKTLVGLLASKTNVLGQIAALYDKIVPTIGYEYEGKFFKRNFEVSRVSKAETIDEEIAANVERYLVTLKAHGYDKTADKSRKASALLVGQIHEIQESVEKSSPPKALQTLKDDFKDYLAFLNEFILYLNGEFSRRYLAGLSAEEGYNPPPAETPMSAIEPGERFIGQKEGLKQRLAVSEKYLNPLAIAFRIQRLLTELENADDKKLKLESTQKTFLQVKQKLATQIKLLTDFLEILQPHEQVKAINVDKGQFATAIGMLKVSGTPLLQLERAVVWLNYFQDSVALASKEEKAEIRGAFQKILTCLDDVLTQMQAAMTTTAQAKASESKLDLMPVVSMLKATLDGFAEMCTTAKRYNQSFLPVLSVELNQHLQQIQGRRGSKFPKSVRKQENTIIELLSKAKTHQSKIDAAAKTQQTRATFFQEDTALRDLVESMKTTLAEIKLAMLEHQPKAKSTYKK